jgi:hypothetical protein
MRFLRQVLAGLGWRRPHGAAPRTPATIYAEPRHVADARECLFYHTLDLPEIGVVDSPGSWDLRPGLDAYLGHVAFAGKRVLDVGAANGALSFHMERAGAEVVSFDLDEHAAWDMVPFAAWKDYAHIAAERKHLTRQLNNAYWLAHRLLRSSARVVYGSVYAIPEAIGRVDIAVYGSILLHLRDPFRALENGARLAREAVIVADVLRGQETPTHEPYLGFLPDASTLEPKDTWWDIRPETAVRMLGVLGFTEAVTTTHQQMYSGRAIELYTVVARHA